MASSPSRLRRRPHLLTDAVLCVSSTSLSLSPRASPRVAPPRGVCGGSAPAVCDCVRACAVTGAGRVADDRSPRADGDDAAHGGARWWGWSRRSRTPSMRCEEGHAWAHETQRLSPAPRPSLCAASRRAERRRASSPAPLDERHTRVDRPTDGVCWFAVLLWFAVPTRRRAVAAPGRRRRHDPARATTAGTTTRSARSRCSRRS